MKKHLLNQRTKQLLIQIHRGFLTDLQTDGLSDEEILENVPDNKGTKACHPGDRDTSEARVSPFTYRWVKQHIKRDPTATSYSLLKIAGFK